MKYCVDEYGCVDENKSGNVLLKSNIVDSISVENISVDAGNQSVEENKSVGNQSVDDIGHENASVVSGMGDSVEEETAIDAGMNDKKRTDNDGAIQDFQKQTTKTKIKSVALS